MRGERMHITLKAGAINDPPAKCLLNGVSLAGQKRPNIKCWLGSFVIFKTIRTSFIKKPYSFVIFRGGGS